MDTCAFSERWTQGRRAGERPQLQSFVIQVCAMIGVPAPNDERVGDPDYCFERKVTFRLDEREADIGFIDCYRRDCFVLEGKQAKDRVGSDGRVHAPTTDRVERLMRTAKRQAEQYAKALDEWPPFLIVVDVGGYIELWSDFARQGKVYAPFPDRARQRITVAQLEDPEVRAMLKAVWTNPMSLDPAARVAAVTTDIAGRLGWLVRSIGARGPQSDDPVARNAYAGKTALYVMQCIFAMFADSVGLIEKRGFLELLKSYRGDAGNFHRGVADFFSRMDTGGHCVAVRQDLKRFNGGLFRQVAPIQITEEELEALIAAAQRDWASVEPAIFGSLLEGALDARERGELGAHYTPRAFVERLVGPTIMEPLRAEWEAVESVAIGLHRRECARDAQAMVRRFHLRLCTMRVLDPACGTGSFLYVAMGMLKELEGEVLGVLSELGDSQGLLNLASHSVSPEQFLGIEKNRYAAWIAQMVLWIGHLQWHFRTFGDASPSEPILKDAGSIQHGDAILAWDKIEFDREATALRARRIGPIDGLFDADDGREVLRNVNPRPATWPDADFIVGNPPFMGAKDMRRELGDGYVDALWHSRQGRFRSADLVTVWWDMAAGILKRRGSRLRRFGFITTNSITQTFSRRVVESHLEGTSPIRLVFAIPDHPWISGSSSAAVRIAMTVAERGGRTGEGCLQRVIGESEVEGGAPTVALEERIGDIGADLRVGRPPSAPLRANAGLCSRGVQLMGAGFTVTPERAKALHRYSAPGLPCPARAYRHGRDLADRPRGLLAIDFYGLTEAEARRGYPGFYQHLLETVKAGRDRNNRAAYRQNWWLFGEPRRELRAAMEGLPRYIATAETAKHRWFRFLDADILPDNKLVVIASDDAATLGVLSSRAHAVWFAAHCGRIGVYDGDAVYVKGACFDAFPFPALSAIDDARIAALAEELEETRERALERDGVTLTGLYNVRDRRRAGEALSQEEDRILETGCVAVLEELHRRIDACVADAYGWPQDLSDAEVLERLQALNRERADEEARGLVRHLRPEFQRGRRSMPTNSQLTVNLRTPDVRPESDSTPEGIAAVVIRTLRTARQPLDARALLDELGAGRGRRMQGRVADTLAILSVAGMVRKTEAGWFAPR